MRQAEREASRVYWWSNVVEQRDKSRRINNKKYREDPVYRERAKERARATREANRNNAEWRASQNESARRSKLRPEWKKRAREYNRTWAQENKHALAERERRRTSAKKQQTPRWLTPEQIDQMRTSYKHARTMSESTGIEHHVDHIVPLNGKSVRGLHVPWNLRVIPAKENIRKGNRLVGQI